MPKGNRRTFTKEFKLGVVYEMLSRRKNGDIFREYDVDRQTAHRWLQEFRSHGESAFDSRNPCPGDEVAKLHRRLKDLQMENEILKKAKAYFAAKNRTELGLP